MSSFRFLKYQVYKDSKNLQKSLGFLFLKLESDKEFALLDQIKRASLSIVLNIAEGSSRYSRKDFKRFLEIALGSLYETVASIDVCLDRAEITDLQMQELLNECANIGRQLSGLIRKLKN